MAHKILNTPGGIGQIPAGNVLVCHGYTGNLATFNGKIFVFDFDNQPDPLNPLNLPENTIRVKFKSGYTPDMGDTQTRVTSYQDNVWDIYKEDTDWDGLFNENDQHYLLGVLGANTKNVTSMKSLFHYCEQLTTVALFDTSNVTDMTQMFYNCSSLVTVPLYDTSNVTNMFNMFSWASSLETVPLFNTSNVENMDYVFAYCSSLKYIPLFDTSKMKDVTQCFYHCSKVETGALALYNQMISQANPPTKFDCCFTYCGSNTQTGSAELAQIPDDWK